MGYNQFLSFFLGTFRLRITYSALLSLELNKFASVLPIYFKKTLKCVKAFKKKSILSAFYTTYGIPYRQIGATYPYDKFREMILRN